MLGLFDLLPESCTTQEKISQMKQIFSGEKLGNVNPLWQFMNRLKKGHFTEYYEKELEQSKKIDAYNSKKELTKRLKKYINKDSNGMDIGNEVDSNLHKRKFIRKGSSESSYSNLSSYNQPLKAIKGNQLSGYTTYDSGNDYTPSNSDNESNDDNNLDGRRNNEINHNNNNKTYEMGKGSIRNIDNDNQFGNNGDVSGNNNQIVQNSQHQKDKDGQIAMPVIRNPKVIKEKNHSPLLQPVTTGTPEWVEKYREQESNRYKNPTKPWIYELPDGQRYFCQ